MQPRKFLEGVQPRQAVHRAINGQAGIIGAMTWMFGLSLALTLILGWVPVVGSFIGPVIGGYIGGRKAGRVGRALLVSIIPALLLSSLILGIGTIAAILVDRAVIGAIAAVIAGALWVILIIYNFVLISSALIGGLVRQIEERN